MHKKKRNERIVALNKPPKEDGGVLTYSHGSVCKHFIKLPK